MTSSFKQVCFVTTRNKNQLFVNVVWASELLKQLMANTMPSVVKGTRWFPRNSHADVQDSLVCMFLQFLARRLTFIIKKGGLLQLKFRFSASPLLALASASALTFHCGRDNFNSFSSILLIFVLHEIKNG